MKTSKMYKAAPMNKNEGGWTWVSSKETPSKKDIQSKIDKGLEEYNRQFNRVKPDAKN